MNNQYMVSRKSDLFANNANELAPQPVRHAEVAALHDCVETNCGDTDGGGTVVSVPYAGTFSGSVNKQQSTVPNKFGNYSTDGSFFTLRS